MSCGWERRHDCAHHEPAPVTSRPREGPMSTTTSTAEARPESRRREYGDDALIMCDNLVRIYQSVSYTHLRAHETRHDLVCRLLLEKKKRKIKQEPTDNTDV